MRVGSLSRSNAFTCACNEDFTGNGTKCERISEDSGCGCRSSRPDGSWLLGLGIVLVAWRRRLRTLRPKAHSKAPEARAH